MTSTEHLPEWIAVNARRRRALIGSLLGALLLHGLVYFNQRAMFMPWNEVEHPLVAPTPTAFFAQASPVGAPLNPVPARFAPAPAPAVVFSAPEGAAAGGADVGEVTPDASVAGLPDAIPFMADGSDGASDGDAVGGAPGGAPAGAGGAPIAFVGPTSVPEMSTWAMLLLGFGVIGAVIRQRGRGRGQVDPA